MHSISVYGRAAASLVGKLHLWESWLPPAAVMGSHGVSAVVVWASSWGLQTLSETTPQKVGAAAWQAAQGRQNQMGFDKHKAAASLTLFVHF